MHKNDNLSFSMGILGGSGKMATALQTRIKENPFFILGKNKYKLFLSSVLSKAKIFTYHGNNINTFNK